MNGKLVAVAVVLPALLAGAAIYYLQVYAFYSRIAPEGAHAPRIALAGGGQLDLPAEGFEGIDASSSPLRFRACLRLPTGLPQGAGFVPYPAAEPLNAPAWFDCFQAGEIEAALNEGGARAYLAEAGIAPGVDRVIAIFNDGRAYVWQQLNPTYQD